jgi:hypothetical protein
MKSNLGLCLLLLLTSTPALADKTLWLTRPLYPGQEALVERTEKAIARLVPPEQRANEVIGTKELASALKGRAATDIPCFTGEERCADPIDAFVAKLGFDQIILIEGGQDEAGFKYKVVNYQPAQKKVNQASSSNVVLESALWGAVAKIAAVASTLEVKSTPNGATVFVDDQKVGVTPLSTQILPGEHVVRVDMKLHQPTEEALLVPIRGVAKLDKTLEKVAARISVTAGPANVSIFVDGQLLGKDRIDRGIQPGAHTLRLTSEGYKAYEQTINVKADEQFTMDKQLEPLPGTVAPPNGGQGNGQKLVLELHNNQAVVVPPPPPPTPTEENYARKTYFHLGFDFAKLDGNSLVGRRFGDAGVGRTQFITNSTRFLYGLTGEYGVFGQYFGVEVIGLSYLTNGDLVQMNVGYSGDHPEMKQGVPIGDNIDKVHINMVDVAVIHPAIRVAFWKAMVMFDIGLNVRSGQITGTVPNSSGPQYNDGFVIIDLLAQARLGFRFYVYDGLYLYVNGGYELFLTGQDAINSGSDKKVHSSSTWGMTGGLGYGF